MWINFQRVKVPYAWGEIAKALASRKVAGREAYTEGSEPAKSGTDEQKRDMRHGWTGEQALLCDAQRLQKVQVCRFRRDWTKEDVLTRGDLGVDSVSRSQEVSRGHSSYWIRVPI